MILPQTYAVALSLMILGMICWGSWANTYKLTKKWRFELYYFDFALGLGAASILYAFTFGNLGYDGFSFMDDVMHAGKRQWMYAFAGGVIFNFSNILLLAAVAVAGMTRAFPTALGIGMVVGALLDYAVKRAVNPALLFGGCGFVLVAVLLNTMAYRALALRRHEELAKAGKATSTRRPSSIKGAVLPIVSGLLIGTYLPLLQKATESEIGLGPYALTVFFAAGAFLSTFVFNLFFMNLPVEGEPVDFFDYFKGGFRRHAMGVLGGIIWCTGAVATFVSTFASAQAADPTSATGATALVSPAVSYGLAHGAALLGGLWGVLAWKELRGAGSRGKMLTGAMFVVFAAGFALISLARVYVRE